MRVKVAPVSVLRHTPPPLMPPFELTTMVDPRAAMLLRFSPAKLADPSDVQLPPPSVVRRIPLRAPPRLKNELFAPMLAASTVLVATVGSRSSELIDMLVAWSVSGIHVGEAAVALVVFQMP